MKKILTLALSIIIIVMGSKVSAAQAEINGKFNLIEFLESNSVESKYELEKIIATNTKNNINGPVNKATAELGTIDEFNIEIDKKNELVYVTQIISAEHQVPKVFKAARSTLYNKSATATKDVYSIAGLKIFTIKSEGEFQYDKNRSCTVTDSSGFFTSSFLSMWDSACSVDDRSSGSTAYVKTYGTAYLKLDIAETLGISLTFQSFEYRLKLICDQYGKISSEWDESMN